MGGERDRKREREGTLYLCLQSMNSDSSLFTINYKLSVINTENLSLLAGLRLSSCFRLLLPGVVAWEVNPQPPLCLLLL